MKAGSPDPAFVPMNTSEFAQISGTMGSSHRLINRFVSVFTVIDRFVSGTLEMRFTGTRPLAPVGRTTRPRPGTTHSPTTRKPSA